MNSSLRILAVVISISFLAAACSNVSLQPPEARGILIEAPLQNQDFPAGVTVQAAGTVLDGGTVTYTLDGGPAVSATLAAASQEGRRRWTAELSGLAVGSHTVTATAHDLEGGPHTATVVFDVIPADAVQPAGSWQGLFFLYNSGGELTVEGTMLVLYNSKQFRMRFDVNEIRGTTEGWDLIDTAGFRMTGTYVPVGGTDSEGNVTTREIVEYHGQGEGANGSYSMRGSVTRD